MVIDEVRTVYFIGIKGTGVCPLAELMHHAGYKVNGSDTHEEFYTDAILKKLNIHFHEKFDSKHITKDIDLVIYSAAYSADSNPELTRVHELGIPALKYTDALGLWSQQFDSTGICGVHGKTTTTAMCGVLIKALAIPAQVLVGSAVVDFDEMSTISLGDKYFIAETCEYRKHFMSFHPRRIILTSVESDHQDYFPDYESIRDAFVEYCRLLPPGGQLFYCIDDPGANEVAQIIQNDKRNIELIPYGFTASGDYRIVSYNVGDGEASFSLAGVNAGAEFKLGIPGRHEALNAAAAIALTLALINDDKQNNCSLNAGQMQSVKNALANFKSTKRRSEIIGETGGIIFMDDYGHHPTAIKTTLEGIKKFYSNRRLIVSFMSHTYTRTSSLLEEFSGCFNDADIVIFHKIYASARESYGGTVNGYTLFEKSAAIRSAAQKGDTYYFEEYDDAFEPLCKMLKSGDLFMTLGAGNNWPLGRKLLKYFEGYHG
ncbi:MAG: UDP-N-acetylmuramate--L-alanine ligase [Treponema sp.]|jgi:UDP-N-acetylmuramate--alanine ligase|nr:UDP-N-acetylmuramate--L-alanine ligase [Treponema sp.]